MIEGWSNDYCNQFTTRSRTHDQLTDCPPKPYCKWDTFEEICSQGNDDNNPPNNDWRKFLYKLQEPSDEPVQGEILEPTFSESKRKFQETLEQVEQELLKQQKEKQEREKLIIEEQELARLESNMNTPPSSLPDSPKLEDLRKLVKPTRKTEKIYPSIVSSEIPSLRASQTTKPNPRIQRETEEDPRFLVDPYPKEDIPRKRAPFQTEPGKSNLFFMNVYMNQPDFDPNSNVPSTRKPIKSISRNRPGNNTKKQSTPKKKSGVSGRLMRPVKKEKTGSTDKPARPTEENIKIVKNEIDHTKSFFKVFNHFLPIIIIFSVLLYLVFAFKKWNKMKY